MDGLIATINAGSSSVKCALFRAPIKGLEDRPVLVASVTGLGDQPLLKWKRAEDRDTKTEALGDNCGYDEAFAALLACLGESVGDQKIVAIGHRIVHGGANYSSPIIVHDDDLRTLKSLTALAPRHQPFNIAGVEKAREAWPDAAQVACFDTAFHRAQRPVNQRYALPAEMEEAGIIRYGFHGLSYEYVLRKAQESFVGALGSRIVIAHLGAGASLCAIRDGKSVATTMGFSTLDGLPMATRVGAIDPGVLLHLMEERGIDAGELTELLYNQGGLLGLSGDSGDYQRLEKSADCGAQNAIEYFIEHCARGIAAMAAAIDGIDSLIFTAGIGENAADFRARILERLAWLGFECDADKNKAHGPAISMKGSAPLAFVIPTNEELMIALHGSDILRS